MLDYNRKGDGDMNLTDVQRKTAMKLFVATWTGCGEEKQEPQQLTASEK
mgnify:CR=1 FL=1